MRELVIAVVAGIIATMVGGIVARADTCLVEAQAWRKKASEQGERNIAAFKRPEMKPEKGNPAYCAALKTSLETVGQLAKEYQELERICGRAPLDGITSQTLAIQLGQVAKDIKDACE
jgi:hypothetical protein